MASGAKRQGKSGETTASALKPLAPAKSQAPVLQERPSQCGVGELKTGQRRRLNIRKACGLCRSKKIRCDGKQPRCSPCSRRNSECLYRSEEAEQHQRALEIVRRLRETSEPKAIELLLRLRSSTDLESALSSAEGRVSNQYRPSEIKTSRALSPCTSSNVEFELTVRHRSVYPPLLPFSSLPDISTTLDRHVLPFTPRTGKAEAVDKVDMPQSTSSSIVRRDYCDERLTRLSIGYWSGVPINDDLAARILSSYFELSHPVLGLFDADLFMSDLVNLRLDYCSAFLVSAVLAYACQSYTGIDMDVASYTTAFLNDARRFWRAEQSSDSIVNVAAILMLSVSGHTYLGNLNTLELLHDGRHMAERLGLLNVRPAPSVASAVQYKDTEWTRAAAHVAHGAYSWLTLNTFYCQLEPIEFPPPFGIPGVGKTMDAGDHLEISCAPHPLPGFMGSTFTSLCGLWSIMQDVAAVYFAHRTDSESPLHPLPISFAESQYQKLLYWADTLPTEMSLQEQSPDHVFIFQPKTLLVTHANSAMLHVSNAMLRDAGSLNRTSPGDPSHRIYFLLALANCGDMYTCFPVFGSIGRGLLSMAVRDGLINSKDAKSLIATFEARGHHHDASVKGPAGAFIIDFELATMEHENARAMELALQFDELSFFAEFTTIA